MTTKEKFWRAAHYFYAAILFSALVVSLLIVLYPLYLVWPDFWNNVVWWGKILLLFVFLSIGLPIFLIIWAFLGPIGDIIAKKDGKLFWFEQRGPFRVKPCLEDRFPDLTKGRG